MDARADRAFTPRGVSRDVRADRRGGRAIRARAGAPGAHHVHGTQRTPEPLPKERHPSDDSFIAHPTRPHPSHRIHRIACSRTSACTSRAPTPPARTTARPSYSASSRLVPSGSSSPKPPAEASRRWNRAACWTFTCTKPRSAADGAHFCSTHFLKVKVGTPRGWRTTGRPRSSSRSWRSTTTLGRTLGKITTLSSTTSTGPLRLPTLARYARGTGDGR